MPPNPQYGSLFVFGPIRSMILLAALFRTKGAGLFWIGESDPYSPAGVLKHPGVLLFLSNRPSVGQGATGPMDAARVIQS